MKLNVYLNFPGTTEEAIAFYQSILGGEMTSLLRWDEAPEGEAAPPPGWEKKIMHATLHTGDMDLMATDQPPDYFDTPQGFQVAIATGDTEEGKRIFTALSEGGAVQMPFEPTFWAKGFGMCTDRFGISWIVNCE